MACDCSGLDIDSDLIFDELLSLSSNSYKEVTRFPVRNSSWNFHESSNSTLEFVDSFIPSILAYNSTNGLDMILLSVRTLTMKPEKSNDGKEYHVWCVNRVLGRGCMELINPIILGLNSKI